MNGHATHVVWFESMNYPPEVTFIWHGSIELREELSADLLERKEKGTVVVTKIRRQVGVPFTECEGVLK